MGVSHRRSGARKHIGHGPAEVIGKRTRDAKPPSQVSSGAAAAERASAGMGTADSEPTDWLFGDTLGKAGSRPY